MKAGSFSVVAAAMLLAAAAAAAQQPPPQPPPPVAAPLPPPPAALSVPDPLAGFRPGPVDLYRSPDGSDRFQHGSLYPVPPPVIGPIYPTYPIYPFGYPYGAPSFLETSMAETYRRAMAETYLRRQLATARGSLLLQALPTAAQVFVDGHYRIAEDARSDGLTINLDAGAHHIEVRAPGYETLAFSVMIEPNSLVRYRSSMQPVATKPAAATAHPAPAKNFYVIPNCYAGDKPPKSVLPKGCDIKKLQTRK